MKTAVLLGVLLLATSVSATEYYTPCGGKCGGYRPPCERHLTCSDGVCKNVVTHVGNSCAKKDCDVCSGGLKCMSDKCVFPPIPCGSSGCGADKKCAAGSTCVGGKCQNVITAPGTSCTKTGCDVCSGGLKCMGGKCVFPPIPCGSSGCGGDKKCAAGSTCVGGKCQNVITAPGTSCAQTGCDVCSRGLMCTDGKCVYPPIPCGSSGCGGARACASGSICVSGKCQNVVTHIGGSCKNSGCDICNSPLVCRYGHCASPKAKCGERCGSYGGVASCELGLHCYRSMCTKFVGTGHRCGGCQVCYWGNSCNSYSHKCTRRWYRWY